MSPPSSNYSRSVLTMALNQAVKRRLLPTNPVNAVERVRTEKREMTVCTTKQVGAFLEQSQPHGLYALL